MAKIATISMYGTKGIVEYVQVVISDELSGKITAHKLWSLKNTYKSMDEATDEIIDFVKKEGAERIYQINKLLNPEFERCPDCGSLMIRKAEVYP